MNDETPPTDSPDDTSGTYVPDATEEQPAESAWWDQPGATPVSPEPEPASPTSPASSAGRRRGTAWVVALALVIGGGVGGGVAALLDDDAPSGSTVVSQTKVIGSADDTIEGDPEKAASVIAPSVVTVDVSGATGAFGRSSTSSGSGIIIRATDSTGFVLTNNHVVDAAVGGGSVHITLSDGKTVPVTIVGRDPSIDLAVLRVTGVEGLKAATFAPSQRLRVGQAVLAVGAPLGLANTVTLGIVSTLNRPVRTGDSDSQQAVFDAIQTDAAINPGNSGGALVDLAGRVVGINTAIASTGAGPGGQAGNIGVGFAIPSSTAVKVSDQLITTGKATHAQIGVSVANAPSSTSGAPGLGASIQSVSPNGPAARAGLRPGDVVTKVNQRRVTDADSLIVAIRAHDPGTTVTLTVTRDQRPVTLRVTLGSVSS